MTTTLFHREQADRRTVCGSMKLSSPLFESNRFHSRIAARYALVGAVLMAMILCRPTMHAQTALPVIVADFNHDGIPDVLVQSTTTPTATIAFGSVPYGTFSANGQAVTFPAACTTLGQGSLVVGDFNGDGFPDMLFFCGSTAGVILGNGDGTFGAVNTLTGATSTVAAVVGDFDHDGKLDIVVLSSFEAPGGASTGLQFFSGRGDGTFNEPTLTNLGQAAYVAPVAADIDGDGYTDLVLEMNSTVVGAPSTVNVFANNKDGTFGRINQGVSAPTMSANVSGTSVPSILVGNFFGSGANDLLVPDTSATPGFYLLQNTSTPGKFSFAAPSVITVAGLTNAVPATFSGSGATDLFVANGTSISALANDGTGNFAPTYTTLAVPSTASVFAVADANGDGYSDVYTASLVSGALQLAVDLTSGTASAISQPFSLGIGTKNVSATWAGNVNFTGSTATGVQLVNGVPTVAAVASSKNPSFVGDSVTLTVRVVSSVPTDNIPTGAIILSDGTTMLASGTLDGTGSFSYTTTALTQATHSITATYAGDAFFAATVSPTFSQVVNHAPAVASNLTWAAPAAIVYGTPLSATQLDATAVDATGVAIPGTFVYTPAAGTILDAGTQTLSVTFTPTDLLSFLVATNTVTLSVTQATPVLTWPTPASIAYGVPLSVTQLDATAAGVTGAALPGVFTYTPAAGAVLTPGTQTLSVSFAPTNALDYAIATGSVKLTVTGLTVVSFTPTTANLGDPDTKITLTGSGFVATSVVQVNGTAVVTTLVNPTTLTAIIPAANFAKVGTLQITVSDPSVALVSVALPFTIAAPAPGATITGPPTTDPGSQPTITFTITKPYPVDLTVTLTLGFASSTMPVVDDPAIQFALGGRTLTFTVPAGTTTVPVIQLQAGTDAGTITIPISLMAGGVDVTPANLLPVVIVVPPAVPALTTATLTRAGNQLTVVMHGYSNTREMMTAKFHFVAAPGADLGTTDLSLPADAIFTGWYSTTESDQYGSTFTYTQIFNTSDSAANIGSVEVTLTNTVGDSTMTTAK